MIRWEGKQQGIQSMHADVSMHLVVTKQIFTNPFCKLWQVWLNCTACMQAWPLHKHFACSFKFTCGNWHISFFSYKNLNQNTLIEQPTIYRSTVTDLLILSIFSAASANMHWWNINITVFSKYLISLYTVVDACNLSISMQPTLQKQINSTGTLCNYLGFY